MLIDSLKSLIRIDNFSFQYVNNGVVEYATNTKVNTLKTDSDIIIDLNALNYLLEIDTVTNIKSLSGSFESIQPLINRYPENFLIKVEREVNNIVEYSYTFLHLPSTSFLLEK